MNKNLAIAIGVLAVIVLAGVVMIPVLFPPRTSMTVTFYDAEDNVVWLERTNPGLFEFDFVTETGSEVVKATAHVDYVVSGQEVGYGIVTVCTFYVDAHLRTITGGFAGDATYSAPALTAITGSFKHDFYFADFVGVESTGKTWGWRINIEATLTCRQDAPDGGDPSDATPWKGNLGFNLDWSEPADFAIVGSNFDFGPT